MSQITDEKPLSAEQEAHKAAFGRAVRMAGGGSRMAAALGVEPSTVSRWERMNYADCPAGHLYTKIDAAAGYPCMLEAIAVLAGYSIRRDEVERTEVSALTLLGAFAEDSGRILRVGIEAHADGHICLRDLNLVEAEGKTGVANINRLVEATRAKYEQDQRVTPLRMTGAAR